MLTRSRPLVVVIVLGCFPAANYSETERRKGFIPYGWQVREWEDQGWEDTR